MSYKKDKNGPVATGALLSGGSNEPFEFSNTTKLPAAKTKDSSRFLTLPNAVGQEPAFLTDF
ncbi:hypothetical protein LEP1GSC068_1100 [Leptospira sp. Fiocruz LV3954]|nr:MULTISPECIES: hypothetical protein [Leptospira]EKO80281.1 hypothetical protein LEP1GSC068_1100 [Leptospira sp. Fiocruz LV3954]EMI66001.1 hypothetical protein LEP1GSC076_3345 [Leptospira sp. Fiocruz LV4135]MDO6381829.1 hypothetical protein [Leptospira santarosai]OLY61231.1 hypothetical protein BV917_06240 [Leptospira santarosai serovar Guaricura]OLY64919.1 hypothetical protein BWD11_07040 [Leptospira santarosai serovar Grippotyphosa]